MKRRELFRGTLAVGAAAVITRSAEVSVAQDNARQPAKNQFPQVSGLTRYVAEFVLKLKYEDIPSEVIALAKKSILDGFGLALAGSASELGVLSRKYVQSLGIAAGNSTIIGSSLKTSPRFAAFANGIFIHADDFDDTQLAVAKDRVYGLLTHPTAPVLPALFAIAEASGPTSAKDFLAAYLAGVETETKIAEAISPRHYEDGFHSSGTCGSFGSVAACARIRGLTLQQTLNAFGIAAAEAGGLRENFGTMTKPFQPGHAAENGVAAADLAALGWTAAEQILEAPRGFFHAYGGTYDPAAIQNKLGNPWTFANPGVSIKPYPSGSLTHPAMNATMRLIQKNNIQPADVQKIDVGTNHNMPDALIHHHPQTGLQAKFSMEFCIAVLLLERKATLAEFTDEYVRRPEVQEMIRRVNFYVDPVAENAGFDKMTSLITVHLRDGRMLKDQADFAKGSPADPMTFQEVAVKFRGCAAYATWPKEKTEMLIETVSKLEQSSDVRELSALLRSSA
jgi:2-methylcitrate dehydratase PrpD